MIFADKFGMGSAGPIALSIWRPKSGAAFIAQMAALVLGGTIALAISAKIQIPFWPVPMTMQSFVVVMIGALYGRHLASITLLSYLFEGLLGIPVFAGSTAPGLAYILGPTGGFLIGFVVAAYVVGYLIEDSSYRPVRVALAFTIGHAAIFILGVLWLAFYTGYPQAISAGVVPFIASTICKIALGVALMSAVRRRA